MPAKPHETVTCQICKKQKKIEEVYPADIVRKPVVEIITKAHPDWSSGGYICFQDLNHFRSVYVQSVIEADKGELSDTEKHVIKSLKEQELLSKNLNVEYDRQLTFGEQMADKVADFGGSWRFIGIFAAILFIWVLLNSFVFFWKPFDPYPFIFLNLILSCLAAIQAPVIMMSQNRQEAKDRLHAEHDYRINLKAELEIRHLHEKIDHLLTNQWQRLLEIQEIQMELMEELSQKQKK